MMRQRVPKRRQNVTNSPPQFCLRCLRLPNIFLYATITQCFGALVPRARARIRLLGLLRQRGREVLTAKGYTKDDAANAMVSISRHAATEVGTVPRLEHVPSAAQLADGVSRKNRTLPKKNGWGKLDLQIDEWRERQAAATWTFTNSYEAVYRQSTRATRPHQRRPRGAFSAGKRDRPPDPAQLGHERDTTKIHEQATKKARSSWFKYYKMAHT